MSGSRYWSLVLAMECVQPSDQHLLGILELPVIQAYPDRDPLLRGSPPPRTSNPYILAETVIQCGFDNSFPSSQARESQFSLLGEGTR